MGMRPTTQADAELLKNFESTSIDLVKEVGKKLELITELHASLEILNGVNLDELNHNLLLNRTEVDAHPISSITGLTEALAQAEAAVYDGTAITARVEDLETGKVDAVIGYGLSQNNLSDYYKGILDSYYTDLTGKANVFHSHNESDIIGLSGALANKQNTLVSGATIKTINGVSVLGSGDIVVAGGGSSDHANLTNRTAVDSHPISAITNLQTTLDSKAAASHSHTVANVTGLQTAIDSKANTTHTHAIADVTGLQTALDSKASSSVVTTTVNGLMLFTDKVKMDSIASNATANSADAFLLSRGNHTGSQAISTVTGLQTALDSKAASAHTHVISDVTGLQTALDGKATSSVVTTTVNGMMSFTDKVKLNTIADSATANSPDATLLNRANHTGTSWVAKPLKFHNGSSWVEKTLKATY